LDPSFNIMDMWKTRFSKTGELLRILYEDLMNTYKGKAIQDLLVYASLAEKTQEYGWAYIDYGIRTPVYRTFQWLRLVLPEGITWEVIIGSGKDKSKNEIRGIVRNFVNELSVHILKEYMLVWSMIMNALHEKLDKDKELRERVKGVLERDIEEVEIKDVKGLESELKASYVLIDHHKSFLPFSIMQAPITPSYIRPGSASGDLYLFEENLVIDIKTGQLARKTKLPTYYYKGGLSKDLRNIGNMRNLYGIRKGIGVIAEDKDYIYPAIYVPWRYWRVQGPLLLLKSLKLPFTIYMNNIVCGDKHVGVKPHEVVVKNGELRLTVTAYEIREQESEEGEEVSSEDITLEFLGAPSVQLKGAISRDKNNPRRFTIEFSVEASRVEKSIIECSGRRVVLAKLIVKHRSTEDTLTYPVLAIM
jgi:hypothetical protein